MATILVGDWADFLGVKRNAVSRAVLMSALPQAHKTLGSKSLTWDYANMMRLSLMLAELKMRRVK